MLAGRYVYAAGSISTDAAAGIYILLYNVICVCAAAFNCILFSVQGRVYKYDRWRWDGGLTRDSIIRATDINLCNSLVLGYICIK